MSWRDVGTPSGRLFRTGVFVLLVGAPIGLQQLQTTLHDHPGALRELHATLDEHRGTILRKMSTILPRPAAMRQGTDGSLSRAVLRGQLAAQPMPSDLRVALTPPRAFDAQGTLVVLRVANPSTSTRASAPVSFGVPLPRDLQIRAVSELGLADSLGRPVAMQGTVLARWNGGPDDVTKPIRWVLLDFQDGVPSRAVREFTLVRGPNAAVPAAAITVKEENRAIEVSTGAATFRISVDRFTVFDQIDVGLRAGGGYAAVVHARPDAGLEFRGRDSQLYRAGPPDSARVEIAGPLHTVVGVRGWFLGEDKQPTFLYYVARYHFHAGQREARLLLTVTDRHDRPAAEAQWDTRWDAQQINDLRLRIDLASPVRSVVLPTPDTPRPLSRFELTPGTDQIRLSQPSSDSSRVSVVAGNRERDQKGYMEASGLNWLPRSDWPGFHGHDFLVQEPDGGRSHVRWVAPIPHAGLYKISVSLPNIPGYAAYLAAKGVTYEIRSSGGRTTRTVDQTAAGWVSLGTFDFADRVEVTLRATGTGTVVADALMVQSTGAQPQAIAVVDRDRAAGWAYVSGGHIGMAFGVRDFWQNAPKDLVATADGRMEIGLLPGGPHAIMGGLGKTHEIIFRPQAGNADDLTDIDDSAFMEPPLHALAPADWYARTHAIGYGMFHGASGQSPEERAYDALIDNTIDPRGPSLVTDVERRNWYGWRNYGDYEISPPYWTNDGAVENWANGMMDFATGALMQYLRSGRDAYWTVGRAAAWHLADIGLVKFAPFDAKNSGTVHRKGECLRSQSHVCQDPIAGQGFAHRSLSLLYDLTGDSWLRETAMMNADYAYNLSAPRLHRPSYLAAAGRDMGWILGALLAGYEQTGATRYLDMARQLFERKLVGQYDAATGAMINPAVDDEYAPAHAPMVQPWMVGITGDALIYYATVTGDARAADLVVGLARFLRDVGVRRARIPAKGEPGYVEAIPDDLAGKTRRYVLYNWTYEQRPVNARVTVRSGEGSRLVVDYEQGAVPTRSTDLRGKLLFMTSGAAARQSFLISSAASATTLSLECRPGTEGRCAKDLLRDGVRPGDAAVIFQPDEYRIESMTYNFLALNTLAFATVRTGDPSYLQLARELFADAMLAGFPGARSASDYLTFPHFFLDVVGVTAK